MGKCFLFTILFSLCILSDLFPQEYFVNYQKLDKAVIDFTNGTPSIALLNFEKDSSTKSFADSLYEFIRNDDYHNRVILYSQNNLKTLISVLDISSLDPESPSVRNKLKKILGIQYVVYGIKLFPNKNTYRLNVILTQNDSTIFTGVYQQSF